MATKIGTTISISQMVNVEAAHPDMILPVVFNGNNYKIKISSITNTITKQSLGLGNVQNISPEFMPVSIPQQQELDKKLNITDKIPQSQVTNLEEDLNSKLGREERIPQSQIIDLTQELYSIKNDPIPVLRVDGFEQAVQTVINTQPVADDKVIQGLHIW